MYNRLLQQAREEKGLSQEALAASVGTSASTISDWERREHAPSAYFREKLSSVLGKSAAELGLLPPTALALDTSIADPFLPVPAVLVGRDTYLVRLRQHVQMSSTSFTVLLGLPGVGKTALAVKLAYDQKIRRRFGDGILWAGLGPRPNVPSLLPRWGKLLGLSAAEMAGLSGREAWVAALRGAIGDRSLLLVIDDAWKLEDILSCSIGGPNCAYVLTTRFPDIAAQVSLDTITRIEELTAEEGMTVLHRLAPRVVEQEPAKAKALVEAVGGLPLGLVLMGNYLRKESYSGSARRIQAALSRLREVEGRLQLSEPRAPMDGYRCLPEEKTLSLQAIIAVADQYLSEETRHALYALAVLPTKPETFSEAAALAVTASSVATLDALLDAGLLESRSEDRYALHQTIADYARLHLQGDKPYERLIAYALDIIEQRQEQPVLLEQERETILAALESGYALRKLTDTMRIATVLVPFLVSRNMDEMAERHVHRMIAMATELEDRESLTRALQYQEDLKQRQQP